MGKKNRTDDGRKTCCLCFRKTGRAQKKLRQLPNGTTAEEECINEKIFKEIIVPIKHVAQLLDKDFNCLSQKNPPEDFFGSVILSIKDYPVGLIQDALASAEKISREIFGKPFQSFIKLNL